MKISEFIEQLRWVLETSGDVEVQLQNDPSEKLVGIVDYESIFVVPEAYEDGVKCNIRSWPY